MFAPLTGVKVIDLTHVLAGPYCTQLLALMGAEVIKVEPPGTGDLTRFGGPMPELNAEKMGLAFCTQNTDKASITVNLKEPEGIDIVHELVASADVFVENFRPGVSERLGLGFETLRALKPGLVYVSLTAYGQDGPIGHRPAYDHVVQAMSGIMETTGTDETGPIKVGAPYVDYAAGQKGAMATMAAIMEQRRTGEAQYVDNAMLDTTLLLMASTLTATANTGQRPAKLGNQAASLSPSSGCYETADGLLSIAANNERQFRDLCQGLGLTELADDPRFAEQAVRKKNADAFRVLLAERLAERSAQEWEQILDKLGVPASRVRSLDELLDEGQPAARQLLSEVHLGADPSSDTSTSTGDDHGEGVAGATTLSLPTAGFKVNGQAPSAAKPPPHLGADNGRLLNELGYDDEQIVALQERGVI